MGVEPLILGSYRKLEVGVRYADGFLHVNRETYAQPFIVLREATRDEWLTTLKAEGIQPPERVLEKSKVGFFYEIAVD